MPDDIFPKDYNDLSSTEGLAFYRCNLCHRIVNIWDLKKHHGCAKCGHPRISPTNLTLWEKLVQIVKHPKVWEWNNETFGQ
jgi:DNA-directed RNA polymerase subunit RPC12/RpoP